MFTDKATQIMFIKAAHISSPLVVEEIVPLQKTNE
jgi:hypothetical protein